jgi:hypothetical protein
MYSRFRGPPYVSLIGTSHSVCRHLYLGHAPAGSVHFSWLLPPSPLAPHPSPTATRRTEQTSVSCSAR